jgi:lipopolysaccharide transport system ATP-binding protein
MMEENNEVLVKVEGLSKKFCKDLKTSLWYGVKDLASNAFGNKAQRSLRDKEFWAVKDVNFELRRGECLGLIGHNGAGKSTLLKILNGLINPDEGKVTINGRVGALIELGAGFNPILTGRENIYNNGAVLGFTKAEIDAKVEAIIDFSEIREFIDMPVQNYSSGMKVRLGFAVAAQMEPDVLIIDEVLAVGDVAFRMKCYNKITSLLSKTAIIFVSHSMPQISKLCTKSILLSSGSVKTYSKNISEVVISYLQDRPINIDSHVSGNGKAKVIKKSFVYNDEVMNEENIVVKNGDEFLLNVDLSLDSSVDKFIIRYIIYDSELKGIMEFSSLSDERIFCNESNQISISVNCINPLNSGVYSITFVALEVDENNRIISKLINNQGIFKFKSVNKNNNLESYIPITLDVDWK